MNGTVLLALGASWNEVRRPHRVKVTAYSTDPRRRACEYKVTCIIGIGLKVYNGHITIT